MKRTHSSLYLRLVCARIASDSVMDRQPTYTLIIFARRRLYCPQFLSVVFRVKLSMLRKWDLCLILTPAWRGRTSLLSSSQSVDGTK